MNLKNNVQPLMSASYRQVLGLNAYQYTFKQDAELSRDSSFVNGKRPLSNYYGFDKSLHYGFSAQEVQKIYPHLVQKDQFGNLAVNYVEMVPLLLQVIKDQEARIQALEAKSR